MPTHTFLKTYMDSVSVIGTTAGPAIQGMWGTRVQAGSLGSTSVPPVNLQLHPLDIYTQIVTNYASYMSAGGNNNLADTARILVRDLSQRVRVTNMGTGPCIFTEYRCRARRDISGSGPVSIATIITSADANNIPGPSSGSPDTVTVSPIVYTTYGSTPFMNPRFVAACKIIKVRRREIMPGKAASFAYRTSKPRVISNEAAAWGTDLPADGSTPLNRAVLKGQSFSVFVAQGTVATASTSTVAAPNNVGIGNVHLGLVYETKANWSYMLGNTRTTWGVQQTPGFSLGSDAFPAPIVQNQPISVITAGTGVRTFPAAGNFGYVVPDQAQITG